MDAPGLTWPGVTEVVDEPAVAACWGQMNVDVPGPIWPEGTTGVMVAAAVAARVMCDGWCKGQATQVTTAVVVVMAASLGPPGVNEVKMGSWEGECVVVGVAVRSDFQGGLDKGVGILGPSRHDGGGVGVLEGQVPLLHRFLWGRHLH